MGKSPGRDTAARPDVEVSRDCVSPYRGKGAMAQQLPFITGGGYGHSAQRAKHDMIRSRPHVSQFHTGPETGIRKQEPRTTDGKS